MENLKNYSSKNKYRFVDFVKMLVVHKGVRESEEQKGIFDSLDADHDGVLSKVELAAALENDEKRAENIMRSFGSGDVIDYTEWVVGTSEKLSVVNLEFAFKYFDKDDAGVIGQQEIFESLKEHGIEKEEISQIKAELNGAIGCKKLNFDEFCQLVCT